MLNKKDAKCNIAVVELEGTLCIYVTQPLFSSFVILLCVPSDLDLASK